MYHANWIGKLNLIKLLMLSKYAYCIGVISIKISAGFFPYFLPSSFFYLRKIDKLIVKFTWSGKELKIVKTKLKKKS